ncbi:MAG: hypothetical protein ACAI44_00540 [Candidatus Sericytochromatia bacterium]
MTWYADLSTETMVDSGEHIRAVGWLAANQPFPQGKVPGGFARKLKKYARNWGKSIDGLGWPVFAGWHDCELCQQVGNSAAASGNFGVPAGGLLYVAPEMIVHYVETHDYLPPQAFIAALMAAPLPGSRAYDQAIAPFRERHRQKFESMLAERYAEAARWAAEQGGDEAAVRKAGRQFFGGYAPEDQAKIRQLMEKLKQH